MILAGENGAEYFVVIVHFNDPTQIHMCAVDAELVNVIEKKVWSIFSVYTLQCQL